MKSTGLNKLALIGGALLLVVVFLSTVHAGNLLRFGVLPVVDTLPLVVGEVEGLLAKEGIDIEIIPFQSALERDAALTAGRLDGYFGDILNTVLLIHAGQDIRIVTTAFHTHPRYRMFGIVAAPDSGIDGVEKLKNKKVAISRATIIEYLLEKMLAAEGFDSNHVVKEEIKKIPVRLQMLLAGKIPAALLPEPLLTLAETKGSTVILDDRKLLMTETVLALKGAWLREKDLAHRFLKAYAVAVDRINQDPETYKSLLIQRTRFPAPVKDRYRMPVFPKVGLPSAGDIEAVQAWLLARKMASSKLPYSAIVLDSAQ
jgi:NitT/TauT family transport system substrate-binding protein